MSELKISNIRKSAIKEKKNLGELNKTNASNDAPKSKPTSILPVTSSERSRQSEENTEYIQKYEQIGSTKNDQYGIIYSPRGIMEEARDLATGLAFRILARLEDGMASRELLYAAYDKMMELKELALEYQDKYIPTKNKKLTYF